MIGCAVQNGFSQQRFVWDYYGLSIEVPDDFKVIKNTHEEFEMSGELMGLYMYIFEENISKELLGEAVAETAFALEMSEIDNVFELTGDGLDGYFVEGYKDGMRVMLVGMIDPQSLTNFMTLITFYDHDNVADSDAIDIINSIRVNK